VVCAVGLFQRHPTAVVEYHVCFFIGYLLERNNVP
jgi:hypothetical protein